MANRITCDGSGNVSVTSIIDGVNESVPFTGGTLTGPTRGEIKPDDMSIDFTTGNNFEITASAGAMQTPVVDASCLGQSGVIVINAAQNITAWDPVYKFKKPLPAIENIEVFAYFILRTDHIVIARVA